MDMRHLRDGVKRQSRNLEHQLQEWRFVRLCNQVTNGWMDRQRNTDTAICEEAEGHGCYHDSRNVLAYTQGDCHDGRHVQTIIVPECWHGDMVTMAQDSSRPRCA